MSTTAPAVDLTLDAVALSTAVPGALVIVPTRPLVGGRRDVFVDVPGKAGSWKFTEEPGDRTLRFEVDILGADFPDRRDAVTALADWCDLGAVAQLIIDDQPDRFHNALLENDPDPDEWLRAATVRLDFRCDPYAYATALSTETIAATGAGSDSDSFTIPDTIDAEPVVEITPTNGTITGFTFILNGDQLAYGGPTIPDDSTVTVSSISDTVTTGVSGDTMLTGAYNPANLVMGLISGGFGLLIPGVNTWALNWTGTATAVTIEITWRRRFR